MSGDAKPAVIGSKTPVASPLSDLPPPSTEGSVAIVPNTPSATPDAGGIPGLPAPDSTSAGALPNMPLPLPGSPPAASAVPPPNLFAGPGLGTSGPASSPLAFPEIRVVREKATPKSWETTLEQGITPPTTNFKYRREVLPDAIYRTEYDHDNRHLPRRMTRDEYANLLFNSIARNDVETTRALLNEGTVSRVVTAFGETPLQYARRTGATEVAALLAARGQN